MNKELDTLNETATEAYLADVSTAPRVTLDEVNRLLELVEYKLYRIPGTTTTTAYAFLNGYHLATEHSYCVNAANFKAEFGEKSATDKAKVSAKEALWQLLGTLLFAHNNPQLFKGSTHV